MDFLGKMLSSVRAFASIPAKTIGGAALVIAIAGVASRLLGFLRDRLLASQFGAGDTLDAYYAAFRIPDTLYNLLVMGALSAAFVPIFTDFLSEKKEKKAWELASAMLQWLTLFLGALSVLAAIFAPALVSVVAPGFSEEKQALTTELTRIMLLSPIFLGISAVFGGVLISFRRFVAYSLAPLLYNLGIILGIILLVPLFGISGLAWGVVAGAVLHMLVQIPAIRDSGFRSALFRVGLPFDSSVRRVVKLMIPRSIGMAANQVGLLLTTVFASSLVSGSLAVFTLAWNIQSIPLGLFAVAFSLAAFPALSISVSKKDDREFFLTLSRTVRRILFFVVPLSLFFIIFRAQFVRVILGSGQFDWADTIATFGVLGWLSASLFAQGLIPLFARGFYAKQDTKTPLSIALIAEAVHIALIPLLLPRFGVDALAIAFSVGSVVNFSLLFLSLRKKVPGWNDREILSGSARILSAALLAGLVAQFSKSAFILAPSPLDTFAEVFLQLIFGLTVGFGSFFLASAWLRIEEFHAMKRWIFCKVLRLPEAASSVEGHPEKGEW
ncbi:MAG: murein biosynthesis integral membrane protein MurJ [Candidatus Moranbacteria bacterium]|nr:murein biosynthesis integral membrane protein MurJ [Candidatus Moranbacteria bacterium]